jgi:hypothetical protein
LLRRPIDRCSIRGVSPDQIDPAANSRFVVENMVVAARRGARMWGVVASIRWPTFQTPDLARAAQTGRRRRRRTAPSSQ